MIQQLIQQEAEKRYPDHEYTRKIFEAGAQFALKNQWVKASEMKDRKEFETYYAIFGDIKGSGYFCYNIFRWHDRSHIRLTERDFDKLFILDENI